MPMLGCGSLLSLLRYACWTGAYATVKLLMTFKQMASAPLNHRLSPACTLMM